ncbi:MAG: (d)CMP kinase [Candidatus Uhrbacteria bacterium]
MRPRINGIITIDGPAGSGKSTIAQGLATRLGYFHLDSGVIYRCITYATIGLDIPFEDGIRIGRMASKLNIELVRDGSSPAQVLVDGLDLTRDIRIELVTRTVAVIAKHPEVRAVVNKRLHDLGKHGGIVCDGRDVGTSVFPMANAKFYLDADLRVRAYRCRQSRHLVSTRDQLDLEREHSPLRRPEDACFVDTTRLASELVVNILHDRSLPLLPR